jgi:hypothetical protein
MTTFSCFSSSVGLMARTDGGGCVMCLTMISPLSFAAERNLARQHLEQNHAQGVNVRAMVYVGSPLTLLRATCNRGCP